MVLTLVKNGHKLSVTRDHKVCSSWSESFRVAPLLLCSKQNHIKDTALLFEEYDHDLKDLHVFKSMTSVCYILSRFTMSVSQNEYYRFIAESIGGDESDVNYCTCNGRYGVMRNPFKRSGSKRTARGPTESELLHSCPRTYTFIPMAGWGAYSQMNE